MRAVSNRGKRDCSANGNSAWRRVTVARKAVPADISVNFSSGDWSMGDYHYREGKGADAAAPLFVVFHGTGGDENQFFDLAGELLPGARIVAPRGDVSEGGALRYFRRTGEGVYDMDDLALRTAQMIAFLEALRAESTPRQVIGLGYSNGANILASVQFAAPALFDATVLMHPLIPFSPPKADFAGRHVLITAGQRDPMAPAAMTQRLNNYFADNGAKASLFWHPGGHELRQEELRETQAFLAGLAAA
jgi:phospholipase/carboxylesterase